MLEAPVTIEPPAAPNPELAPEDPADDPVVLEHEQCLSRSLLWSLQRAFFAREGIEAWRTHTVPHYVAS
jgi:hypothetical protein